MKKMIWTDNTMTDRNEKYSSHKNIFSYIQNLYMMVFGFNGLKLASIIFFFRMPKIKIQIIIHWFFFYPSSLEIDYISHIPFKL